MAPKVFAITLTDQLLNFVTGAFSLIAALAWNTAIQESISKIDKESLAGPYLYAFLITLLATLVVIVGAFSKDMVLVCVEKDKRKTDKKEEVVALQPLIRSKN